MLRSGMLRVIFAIIPYRISSLWFVSVYTSRLLRMWLYIGFENTRIATPRMMKNAVHPPITGKSIAQDSDKRGRRYGYQRRNDVSDQNEYQRGSECEDHLLVGVRCDSGSDPGPKRSTKGRLLRSVSRSYCRSGFLRGVFVRICYSTCDHLSGIFIASHV